MKLFDAHKGICYLCETKILVGEPWIQEHVIPRMISGDDELSNLRPVHVRCAKEKTKQDQNDIAKVLRIRAKHIGAKESRRPMMGSKKSRLKRKFDGTVVDRETGKPVDMGSRSR